MTVWQVLMSVTLGLAINECSELYPWCARKAVRWSAFRRYTDPGRAKTRAEELTALIDSRPGKLFKLITALGFAVPAGAVAARRAATRRSAAPREGRPELPVRSGEAFVMAGDELTQEGIRASGRRDSGRRTAEAIRQSRLARESRAHARGTPPLPRRTPRWP